MRLELYRLPMLVLLIWMLSPAASSQTADAKHEVTGESWLNHLKRPFNDTSMGKTGDLGPAASTPSEAKPQWSPTLSSQTTEKVTLRSADLYRLNCRGCHGESGSGSPPEIHSVINPVRATSAALVRERLKSSGMDISGADAAQMAKQAEDALLLRFQKGGEAMPSFAHLQPAEERQVIAYLNELAGVPGGHSAQASVSESPARVGELIVKSTCHICHDATGSNPDPQQILQGAIPPLSTLTNRTTEAEFIRKVTHGAPVLMGDPPIPARGRMPVFYYLTEDEAADVYLYLMLYPPRLSAETESAAVSSNGGQQGLVAASIAGGDLPTPPSPASESTDGVSLFFVLMLASVVSALLFGGLFITIHEFSRLSARRPASAAAGPNTENPVVQVASGERGMNQGARTYATANLRQAS